MRWDMSPVRVIAGQGIAMHAKDHNPGVQEEISRAMRQSPCKHV